MASFTLETMFGALFVYIAFSSFLALLLPFAFAPLVPAHAGNYIVCNALSQSPNISVNASNCGLISNFTNAVNYSSMTLNRNITSPIESVAFSSNGFGASNSGGILGSLGSTLDFIYAGFTSFISAVVNGIPLIGHSLSTFVTDIPTPYNAYFGALIGFFITFGIIGIIMKGISMREKIPVTDI